MDNGLPRQVRAPAGFVPEYALAFGDPTGGATLVTRGSPLPVETRVTAAAMTPLAGSTVASGTIGPFIPELARPIWVQLSGTWTGSVRLLRSRDGGATRLPLSYPDGSARGRWSANVNAAVVEESVAGATYYLDIALTAGALSYQLEQ